MALKGLEGFIGFVGFLVFMLMGLMGFIRVTGVVYYRGRGTKLHDSPLWSLQNYTKTWGPSDTPFALSFGSRLPFKV